jgi:hypothetical protein
MSEEEDVTGGLGEAMGYLRRDPVVTLAVHSL